ncbi:MAG TPA: RNA polymerase sigma factor [Ktedonobacterales bacterium]|nr:RNA polymerase sigma factor [Ktedonobacterales bacterium]
MRDNQGDAYAERRAQLEVQFTSLPPAGSSDYWQHIEESDIARRLPLEVLARCYRERNAARVSMDAERIFSAIMRQTQAQVRQWARSIARQAKSGMAPQLQQELEQECFMKLWEELANDDPAFLLVNFTTAFLRLRQHVAHTFMEKAGEWQRPGVETPTRVPSGEIVSLQAEPDRAGEEPLEAQLADTTAHDPFQQIELSRLLALVRELPENQRTVIIDRFWRGLTQEETAAKLGISPRMVRYLLTKALRELGVRYGDGEEGNGV